MTGTAETEAGEFYNIYKLGVVVIPTHKPMVRNDQPDLIFLTEKTDSNILVSNCPALPTKGTP